MISISFEEAARPRVVVPPGWTMRSAELLPPDGPVVVLGQAALRPGDELSSVAAREGERLAEALPSFEEGSLEERRTRSGAVLLRRYGWQESGEKRHGVQLLGPAGATATIRADDLLSEDLLAAVAELVGALVFGAPQGLSGTFSVEELAALAELMGAGSFPGTGDYALESDRERAAARRALLARGTLRAGSNGSPELGPLDARTVATALEPNAIVSIGVARPGAAADRCIVYVGDALSVAHSAGAQGIHRLEAVPSALLGRLVLALAGPGRQPPETSATIEVVQAEEGKPADAAVAWVEHEDGPRLVRSAVGTPEHEPITRERLEELIDSLCAPILSAGGRA